MLPISTDKQSKYNRSSYFHCFVFEISSKYRKSAKDIEILVGTNKLSSGGTRYKVKKTIPHEKFNQPVRANDIALIRTQMPIKFNAKVTSINYSTKEIPPGKKLQISGWGRLMVGSFTFIDHTQMASRHIFICGTTNTRHCV